VFSYEYFSQSQFIPSPNHNRYGLLCPLYRWANRRLKEQAAYTLSTTKLEIRAK
jgi:hypothetical protein